MANLSESLVASAPIKCPADKFYNFFKFSMHEIVKIYPAAFTGAQILQGEEGTVGCVTLLTYVLGGVTLTIKLIAEAINDSEKSITLTALEGDVLKIYKSFKRTLSVSDGLATWTFEYEKLTPTTPPPELCIPLAITLCTLVDAYLLIN